jgi:hypothetical protein
MHRSIAVALPYRRLLATLVLSIREQSSRYQWHNEQEIDLVFARPFKAVVRKGFKTMSHGEAERIMGKTLSGAAGLRTRIIYSMTRALSDVRTLSHAETAFRRIGRTDRVCSRIERTPFGAVSLALASSRDVSMKRVTSATVHP